MYYFLSPRHLLSLKSVNFLIRMTARNSEPKGAVLSFDKPYARDGLSINYCSGLHMIGPPFKAAVLGKLLKFKMASRKRPSNGFFKALNSISSVDGNILTAESHCK